MSEFFADYVNRIITIDDVDVVLMPDMVGPVPLSEQHMYVELQAAENQTPAIHVNETDIENIREAYPGIAIYGLWQTLLNSGVISFRKSLQVVQASPMDGFYIHCDLGRAEFSGDYEAGFFAADAGFTLDDAAVIAPSVDSLTLPAHEAKMAEELQIERKMKARKAWSSAVSVAVLVAILAVLTDFSLLQYYKYEHQEALDKSAMRDYLRAGLDGLKTSRITDVPNDHQKIERIAELWAYERRLATAKPQMFDQQVLSFTVPDNGADPKNQIEWLTTQYLPQGTGKWAVSFLIREEK